MSEEEFEFILAAVEFVAAYGQRFLPLYRFNLRTGSWAFRKKALKELLRKENNSNLHVLLLANTMHAVNLEDYNSNGCDDVGAKQRKNISKYRAYLEVAKYIASLLPKFPSQRRLPEDMDTNLLQFRI